MNYRKVVFYKDYFNSFFIKQPEKVKNKILWTLSLIEILPRIPETYFKHIESSQGIFEIRVQYGGNIYRILCFFDEEKLVILMNAFQKKTQKLPRQHIERALKIKQEYENEKK